MYRFAPIAFLVFVGISALVLVAEARPAYARNENRQCGYCHTRPQGGGERGFRGQFYGANGLSFDHFKEEREALIAGVAPRSEGAAAIPKASYVGNVGGPATQQIQLASLRGPVVFFFVNQATPESKLAAKTFASLATSLGQRATFLAVTRAKDPIMLTEELGGRLRVLPDPEGKAAAKFSATCELDFAIAEKLGDPMKSFQGISRTSISEAIKLMGGDPKTALASSEWSALPEKTVRGSKL
jgi:hypothetical protein